MSDATRQFSNLPQSTWSCWDGSLVAYLKSQGCDSVHFGGGNSGTLSFQHPLFFAELHFALTYSYDPSAQALTLTITDSPPIVSNDAIFDRVQAQIYKCPQ
jgi:hypothetical protein